MLLNSLQLTENPQQQKATQRKKSVMTRWRSHHGLGEVTLIPHTTLDVQLTRMWLYVKSWLVRPTLHQPVHPFISSHSGWVQKNPESSFLIPENLVCFPNSRLRWSSFLRLWLQPVSIYKQEWAREWLSKRRSPITEASEVVLLV